MYSFDIHHMTCRAKCNVLHTIIKIVLPCIQPVKHQFCFQALGCGPADYEGHVKLLVAAKKESLKEKKSLMDELAGLHGRELAHQVEQQGAT